jgi:hypothetical protein
MYGTAGIASELVWRTCFTSHRRDAGMIPALRLRKRNPTVSVFVKGVVRRFHAASLISEALVSRSGLSQTAPVGRQLRVLPDQRSGFCARAFA